MYIRPGSRRYWMTLPTRVRGEYVHLSTGSFHKPTAEAIERMMVSLGPAGSRQWDLYEAVLKRRLDVGRLYDAWTLYLAGDAAALDQLRAELADVDLAPAIEAWHTALPDHYRGESLRKYPRWADVLFPRDEAGKVKPVLRSVVLARGYLKKRLAAVPGSRTNRRRHAEAWLSVFEAVVEAGLLERNPMRDVKKPEPDASKTPHLDRYEDVLRLVHAFPEGPHRAIAALREGAGMEMQAVLAMRARDVVDVEERIVWAHGEKNAERDRQVLVDAECFDVFMRWFRAAGPWLPDAPLFRLTKRGGATAAAFVHREVHAEVCAQLRKEGLAIPKGYTPHAARHTFAIRWLRRGVEETLVANNLGHADTTEVRRRYGKYKPKITDIKRAGQGAKGGR